MTVQRGIERLVSIVSFPLIQWDSSISHEDAGQFRFFDNQVAWSRSRQEQVVDEACVPHVGGDGNHRAGRGLRAHAFAPPLLWCTRRLSPLFARPLLSPFFILLSPPPPPLFFLPPHP